MAGWPKWATVRAEQVRTVLADDDDWGPWVSQGECSRGSPGVFGAKDTGHAAEPPYFFHCRSCISVVHADMKIPSPNAARDQGLCLRCGQPAELDRIVVRMGAVAAQQAESRGVTIARLSTRTHCRSCDPYGLPFCKALHCPDKEKRHRATAVCSQPRTHRVPHCAAWCAMHKAAHAARSQKLRARRKLRANPEGLADGHAPFVADTNDADPSDVPPFVADTNDADPSDVPPFVADTNDADPSDVPPFVADTNDADPSDVPPFVADTNDADLSDVPPFVADTNDADPSDVRTLRRGH